MRLIYNIWHYIILLLAIFICSGVEEPLRAQEHYWRKVATFENTHLMSVACADSADCMIAAHIAAGAGTAIYHSTDGGIRWSEVYHDTIIWEPVRDNAMRLYTIQHPTRDLALVGCDSGSILRTTDGGASWQQHQIADLRNVCEHLSMYDDKHGIASFGGPDVPLFVTSNGGETWARVQLPLPQEPGWDTLSGWTQEVACIAPYTYLCSVKGPRTLTLFHSSDGGKTWAFTPSQFGPKYDTVHCTHTRFSFLDSLHGFVASSVSMYPPQEAVGRRTLLSRTTDGGRTWKLVYDEMMQGDPVPEDPLKIAFKDTLHGFVAGAYRMYRTIDGGRNWTMDSVEINPVNAPMISFSGGHQGIAIAHNVGTVLLWTPLVSSIDVALEEKSLVRLAGVVVDANYLVVRQTLSAPAWISLSLHDLLGRRVAELPAMLMEEGEHEARIDISSIPSGTYFLRLLDGEGTQQTASISITR